MNRFDRPRQALAIVIAALAGFVDAQGFLSADRYFVSFMSGNTTRLAVEIATNPAQALAPALLIAGFVTGVALGSIMAAMAGARRKPMLLLLVTCLLLAAALSRLLGSVSGSLAAMVLAMGVVNNTFQRDGEVAVGLTYMTGTLVKLGQALGATLMGKRQTGTAAYLMLWFGLLGGAVAGALLFTNLGAAALWLTALLAAVLAGCAWRIEAR
jgi:uncharacterized membrane protein YoaK (UPF0700 family)